MNKKLFSLWICCEFCSNRIIFHIMKLKLYNMINKEVNIRFEQIWINFYAPKFVCTWARIFLIMRQKVSTISSSLTNYEKEVIVYMEKAHLLPRRFIHERNQNFAYLDRAEKNCKLKWWLLNWNTHAKANF